MTDSSAIEMVGGQSSFLRAVPGLCAVGIRDEEQTRAEMGFIHGALGLPRRAKVLDVPCGAGRLALELAAWGYDVTGIDQSAEVD